MARLVSIFVPLDDPELEAVARAVGGEPARVIKRSLDARKGRTAGFHLQIAVGEGALADEAELPAPARARAGLHAIVVGSGPAGTWAALRLAAAGAQVTLVEAGKPVQPRRHDLAALTQRGALDPLSNYCFGEGGAGTFSDGKLYTRTKDRPAVRTVLRTLVEHGARADILVESRPHIGSNHLPRILMAMREKLERSGTTYIWSDPVVDLVLHDQRVIGVRTRSGRELRGDAVLLATGHSARPIYEMLHARGVALQAKSFAIGARIEHPQPLIDRLQYGAACAHPKLGAAFYEVTAKVAVPGAGDRGVYSFCMCPGGWVVNASTEAGALCTNGMSLSRRDSPRANAALVVTVEPRDYLADHGGGPLAGLEFQRALERRAFALGGGDFVAAAQRVPDFRSNRVSENMLPSSYRPSVRPGDVRSALPRFIGDALDRAFQRFDKMLPGFASADAQLVGIETRSSAPVRIVRDESLQSPTHPGLYPLAEGAGYAGGIVSAAIDGLRAADALLA